MVSWNTPSEQVWKPIFLYTKRVFFGSQLIRINSRDFFLVDFVVPWRTTWSWGRRHRTRTTLRSKNLWPVSAENHHQRRLQDLLALDQKATAHHPNRGGVGKDAKVMQDKNVNVICIAYRMMVYVWEAVGCSTCPHQRMSKIAHTSPRWPPIHFPKLFENKTCCSCRRSCHTWRSPSQNFVF